MTMDINQTVQEILESEKNRDRILDFFSTSGSEPQTLAKYPVSVQQLRFWQAEKEKRLRLQKLDREELLQIINEEETDETRVLYDILKDVHNIDMGVLIGNSVSEEMKNLFITAMLHWKFHIITFYMYELGRYFKKVLTVNGKWEFSEITEAEFGQCKNASAVRNHQGQVSEFGIEISSIWQAGLGDDLAASIEDNSFILVFDDVRTDTRKLSPHEISGIQLLVSFLGEKLKGRKDPLTGILNRRSYEEHLNAGTHQKGYFLMLDVDHFKKVNDTHGHAFGDFVLKKIAAVLKDLVRERDKLYRWGGEEFLVWIDSFTINGSGMDTVLAVAERIRNTVEETDFSQNGTSIRLTISVGVSFLDTTGKNIRTDEKRLSLAETAIVSADEALYRAKETGRNRVMHSL